MFCNKMKNLRNVSKSIIMFFSMSRVILPTFSCFI